MKELGLYHRRRSKSFMCESSKRKLQPFSCGDIVVRALAFLQSGMGSIPRVVVIYGLSLFVLCFPIKLVSTLLHSY